MSGRTVSTSIRKNINKDDSKNFTNNSIPITNKPKKLKKRNGNPIYEYITYIFVVLILFWLSVLYHYALPFLMKEIDYLNKSHKTIRHDQSNQKKDDSRNILQHSPKHKNPYEGWQLKIHSDLTGDDKCNSWRKCFSKDHNCPGKCRDGKDDWGTPPSPPPQWIPDVTVLRRMMLNGKDEIGNPWPPPLLSQEDHELCESIGVFGGKNDENKPALNAINIRGMPLVMPEENKYQPKILCMVYTMEENHHTSIRAIRETWAGGCDGFLAFSTADDPRIPAISLEHDGPEAYDNMWQKVRSIWRFVGKHYLDQFDYFFQGGEDLYVLPQNLRHYLANTGVNPKTDDFFGGRRFQQTQNVFFNSGGAGYVLSQETLRKFVTIGLDHPKCFPDSRTSMEDVMIAQCLKDVFDIGLVDTRDEDGRERFHPFAPGTHYNWKPPIPPETDWYEAYNRLWPPKLKELCCAPDSVSFHYMKKPAMVRHIHSLLYFCDQYDDTD